MSDSEVILRLKDLRTLLGGSKGLLRRRQQPIPAVDGVNLSVRRGSMVGIVGESGCGKTTLARTILGIQREASGEILLHDEVVTGLSPRRARAKRSDIQYVYQDAPASLDPWWSVGRTLHETLAIRGVGSRGDRAERIERILAAVGLDFTVRNRYPHELSGGQLKRVSLARTLLLSPQIVILDEPTAGLDLSVQAAVLKLILSQHKVDRVTYLLITHDLSVVRRVCDSVAIMYLGRIVEVASAAQFFRGPAHPYARLLLKASPRIDRAAALDVPEIVGEPPSFAAIPSGCRFRTRCAHATDRCANEDPELVQVADEHWSACHYSKEIAALPLETAPDPGSALAATGGRKA